MSAGDTYAMFIRAGTANKILAEKEKARAEAQSKLGEPSRKRRKQYVSLILGYAVTVWMTSAAHLHFSSSLKQLMEVLWLIAVCL